MYNNLHQVYSTSFEDFADKDSAWLRSTLIKKQHELNAIIQGSKAILGKSNFTDTAREIFDQCCNLTGATSGYVALLSEDGSENEVLFLEDGGVECTVDPELPMPIRGLRAESYVGNCAVYHNDFMNSPWMTMMPEGHMTLDNVMFSPLVIDDKTVGIMGLANKSSDFTDRDADIATVFGELAAIALQNSRFLEERQRAEDSLSETVKELQAALTQIKTLKGIVPICMYCKEIRDDDGYWNKLEKFITEHSEAEFSHGICPDCMKKHYPGYMD